MHCMTVLRVRFITLEGLVTYLKMTWHKCKLPRDDGQSACLTKVISRSRSYFKVKLSVVSALYF